jgi:arylsulfate sulfotransferase
MVLTTPVKGKVKIKVHAKAPDGIAVENVFEHFGQSHTLPVLGLYEAHSNTVELFFLNENGSIRCSDLFTIDTPAIEGKPTLDIQILHPQMVNLSNAVYMISNLKLAFDSRGEIRWIHKGEGMSYFNQLSNGNFLTNAPTNDKFYEVTMLGEVIQTFYVPPLLHHEIHEMPAGNFLVASGTEGTGTIEDAIVEVSRQTGQVIRSWDFRKILDDQRPGLPDSPAGDWLHINALYYDPCDNSIVVSGRNQSAVVKIDYRTGELIWILCHPKHWKESLQPFLLSPVDAQGKKMDIIPEDFWSYAHHAVQRTANGNLLLYDNGTFRGYYDDPSSPAISYSRAAEYKIDKDLRTVSLVWKFDNAKTIFTRFTGYTQEINAGESRLLGYAFISDKTPRLIEINAQNQVLFEATVNRAKAAYYRILKVNLYESPLGLCPEYYFY